MAAKEALNTGALQTRPVLQQHQQLVNIMEKGDA
jgi:hypothetical protein